MNGVYDSLFFQLNEGGRRGHDQKLFKKRLRLGNTLLVTELLVVIDNWNSLIVFIVKLNTLMKHLSPALESGAV